MSGSKHSRATILLVESDQLFAEMLCDGLVAQGYAVRLATTRAAAEALVGSVTPDLILMELMLPDAHGLLLCAELMQRVSAPIIVCSGTRRRDDAALAIKLGAADFVAKPVSLEELGIRIQRALRMQGPAVTVNSQTLMTLGPLSVDRARRMVTVSGGELATTPTEYRLLAVLLERVDEAVSMRELAETVWGHHDSTLEVSLRVHLRRLRGKLSDAPGRCPELVAVRGFGYRLVWPRVSPSRTSQR